MGHSLREYLLELSPPQLAEAADNRSKKKNHKPTLIYYNFPYPDVSVMVLSPAAS